MDLDSEYFNVQQHYTVNRFCQTPIKMTTLLVPALSFQHERKIFRRQCSTVCGVLEWQHNACTAAQGTKNHGPSWWHKTSFSGCKRQRIGSIMKMPPRSPQKCLKSAAVSNTTHFTFSNVRSIHAYKKKHFQALRTVQAHITNTFQTGCTWNVTGS